MNENTIHLVDIPIGGKEGFLWNRLHGEREEICEALLKESEGNKELLQSRLRKLDDALDRVMSGSYGHCSQCGRSIDDSRLDIDPALAFCLDCWGRKHAGSGTNSQPREPRSACDLPLENVNPFDSVLLKTHNSDYRILLLDPKIGRALVEGGSYLTEPTEALLKGSAVPGSAFRRGEICVGCRLEMWVDERVFITSPVKSVEVVRHADAESVAEISEALH
jgi:DksA/TraR C4-type zinc finger protein